jgi:GntR family transcriptional regulator, transcriptional repressor for pyruvate dehydrogenase complex
VGSTSDTKRLKARFKVIGRKDGLVDRVVEAIEGQILGGRLAVGARLPPEREFSEHLQVSRPVVREAVRILTTRGMLETKHGIGTTVRAISRDEVVKPMTLFLRVRGQDISIQHLHQVRSILEVENAGLAAEQRTEQDVNELSRLCAEMEAAAGDAPAFARKDSEFHRRLSETTYNPLLILLLDSIQDMMGEVRALVANQTGLFERVTPTHLRILDAVASRNPAGAREAMREHLEIALEIQCELIEKKEARESAG